jgi:hypothetical protein
MSQVSARTRDFAPSVLEGAERPVDVVGPDDDPVPRADIRKAHVHPGVGELAEDRGRGSGPIHRVDHESGLLSRHRESRLTQRRPRALGIARDEMQAAVDLGAGIDVDATPGNRFGGDGQRAGPVVDEGDRQVGSDAMHESLSFSFRIVPRAGTFALARQTR